LKIIKSDPISGVKSNYTLKDDINIDPEMAKYKRQERIKKGNVRERIISQIRLYSKV